MDILEGNEAVYQDISGSFSCEFRSGDSERVRSPAKAVREEEDVRVSSCRDQKRSKIVNADGYSRAVGQGDGERRPANGLAGCFPCLTLEAASHPPFGARFHTCPPIKALQHFECACDT